MINHKLTVAGLVGAALLAACSSSTQHTDSTQPTHAPTGPLSRALAQVAADDNTRGWVEYGRPKAIAAADSGAIPTGPYAGALGYGFSDLVNYALLLPPLVGFDATTADVALTAGQPPTHAGWLSGGVDAAKVEQALTKLGAKKDGASLRLGADNELGVDGPLAKQLQAPLPILNVVSTSGSSLRYGTSAAAIDLLGHPGGGTLASDAAVTAVADCLGDPLAAVLTDQPTGSGPHRELGLGVSGTSAADATVVMCVATGSASDAATLKAKVQEGLAAGKSQRSNQPWSQLLTGVSVEVASGNVVRATAHPGAGNRVSILFDALRNKDLASLIGS